MDAMKILGAVLGSRQVPSRTGRRVVSGAHPSLQTGRSAPRRVNPGAVRLPGVLGAAAQQQARRTRSVRHTARGHVPGPRYVPAQQAQQAFRGAGFGGYDRHTANQRATLLVRAMISAAKADGCVDRLEEQRIAAECGTRLTNSELQWIRQEIAKPIDICSLARDTPPGMEQELYLASLLAINLDTDIEAQYMQELARELRLTPHHCNRMHQRYGQPTVFR